MSTTSSADVRAALKHPVVDADGHWLEPMPIFLDFLRDEGGPHALDTYRRDKEQADLWYRLTAAERAIFLSSSFYGRGFSPHSSVSPLTGTMQLRKHRNAAFTPLSHRSVERIRF